MYLLVPCGLIISEAQFDLIPRTVVPQKHIFNLESVVEKQYTTYGAGESEVKCVRE